MIKKGNRKVIGAEEIEVDGIKFRSRLEASCYRLLKESGLNPSYEEVKIEIFQGFKPSVPYYLGYPLKMDSTKVRAITYTPDFIVKANGKSYYLEVKGFRTDSYNIKVKLFRKWLEENDPNSEFYEVKSLIQLKQIISEISNDQERIIP